MRQMRGYFHEENAAYRQQEDYSEEKNGFALAELQMLEDEQECQQHDAGVVVSLVNGEQANQTNGGDKRPIPLWIEFTGSPEGKDPPNRYKRR